MNNEEIFDILLESVELLEIDSLDETVSSTLKKSIEEYKPKPDKRIVRLNDNIEKNNRNFFDGTKTKKNADNFYRKRKKIIEDMRERIKTSEEYNSSSRDKAIAIAKLAAGAGIGMLPGPTSIPAIGIASSGIKDGLTKPTSKRMSLNLLKKLDEKLDSTYEKYYTDCV